MKNIPCEYHAAKPAEYVGHYMCPDCQIATRDGEIHRLRRERDALRTELAVLKKEE